MYVLLTALSRYPHRFNYLTKITDNNAEYQYRLGMRMLRVVKISVLLLMVYVIWSVIQSVVAGNEKLPKLFFSIGNGRIYRANALVFLEIGPKAGILSLRAQSFGPLAGDAGRREYVGVGMGEDKTRACVHALSGAERFFRRPIRLQPPMFGSALGPLLFALRRFSIGVCKSSRSLSESAWGYRTGFGGIRCAPRPPQCAL